MTSFGHCSTSVISFDQNWHHFCLKRFFRHWYSDRSVWVNGAWNIPENVLKLERKTQSQSKVFLNYTWLLLGKNFPSRWYFFRNSLTTAAASPEEGQQLQRKDKKMSKRKGEKKIKKTEKPKGIGHFLAQKSWNFDFCATLVKMS